MHFHATDYQWWVWFLDAIGGAAMCFVAAFLGAGFVAGKFRIVGALFWIAAIFFATGTVFCLVMGVIRLVT